MLLIAPIPLPSLHNEILEIKLNDEHEAEQQRQTAAFVGPNTCSMPARQRYYQFNNECLLRNPLEYQGCKLQLYLKILFERIDIAQNVAYLASKAYSNNLPNSAQDESS